MTCKLSLSALLLHRVWTYQLKGHPQAKAWLCAQSALYSVQSSSYYAVNFSRFGRRASTSLTLPCSGFRSIYTALCPFQRVRAALCMLWWVSGHESESIPLDSGHYHVGLCFGGPSMPHRSQSTLHQRRLHGRGPVVCLLATSVPQPAGRRLHLRQILQIEDHCAAGTDPPCLAGVHLRGSSTHYDLSGGAELSPSPFFALHNLSFPSPNPPQNIPTRPNTTPCLSPVGQHGGSVLNKPPK